MFDEEKPSEKSRDTVPLGRNTAWSGSQKSVMERDVPAFFWSLDELTNESELFNNIFLENLTPILWTERHYNFNGILVGC